MCDGTETQTLTEQIKPSDCRSTSLVVLIDVRQMRKVPVPVAFQAEPVLRFVVRVWSLLEPPAEISNQTCV